MTHTMTVANKVTCKELWTRSRTTEKVQLTPGSLTFCSNVVGVRWKLCSGTKYPSSNPISITRYTPSWNWGHTKSTLWKWDSSHKMPQSTPIVISILSTSQSTHHHQTVATQNQCRGNETEVVEWHKVFLSNLNPTNFTKYTLSWNCGHRKPMLWERDSSCGMPQSIPTSIWFLSVSQGTPHHETGHTKSVLWEWDGSHGMPQSIPIVFWFLSISQSTPHHRTATTHDKSSYIYSINQNNNTILECLIC